MLADAEIDYREVVARYKGRSDEEADRFLLELADALESLENNPPFYGFHFNVYRRILLRTLPYKIVYEIDGGKVIIHAGYHTGRNDAESHKRLP